MFGEGGSLGVGGGAEILPQTDNHTTSQSDL